MKEKIAIIGPFNSLGGRELEVGFIADLLMANYDVTIYSTESIELLNDMHAVNNHLKIYQRKKYKSTIFNRFLSATNKNLELRFVSLSNKKVESLDDVIRNVDIVFVIAQIISLFTNDIILKAHHYNKKILFRTTGNIPENIKISNPYFHYLDHVHLFINHSVNNSKFFEQKINLHVEVIDQCVVFENIINKFVSNPAEQVTKFYTASRLDNNKDVLTVIKAFNKFRSNENLELHVIGSGPELPLAKQISENERIYFYDHLDFEQMIRKIANFDCLIISSIEEAGPYNALEAMALGKLIISTPVGAMKERLPNSNIWFEPKNIDDLCGKITEYATYDSIKIQEISAKNRDLYLNSYSKSKISQSYLQVVEKYLNDLYSS